MCINSTKGRFVVKHSFSFAKEIVEQDSGFSMGSLDVDSLFNNIPLKETIYICIIHFFEIRKNQKVLQK